MSNAAEPNGPNKTKKTNKTNRKKGGFLYRLISLILIAIILVSGYHVGKALYQYYTARHGFKEVQKTANVDPDQFTGVIDFEALWKVNPEVQGWIYQKDTIINYPVMQADNNDKYLHADINGNYSVSGSIFVDSRNTANFQDFNTIIYGHHMNDGSMFKSLRGYTKEDDYYADHKTLELVTPERPYHLQVISSYITAATSEAYRYQFSDDADKQAFIDTAISKSAIITDDISVTPQDRLITLSTCAYDYDDARYVVICKMVPWSDKEIARGKALQAKIGKNKK